MIKPMRMAKYSIKAVNDLMVIIYDDKCSPSVSESAGAVIKDLNTQVGSLGSRRVYYRDSVGRVDELCHSNGVFTGFAACKPSQQESFKQMTREPAAEHSVSGHACSRERIDAPVIQQSCFPAGKQRLRDVLPPHEG